MAEIAAHDEWRPRHSPWLIALGVMLATFMQVLDTSIANIALPHIAGSLSATPDEATWVLTSYLVSNAIILPMTGWLGNYFGRKRLFICVRGHVHAGVGVVRRGAESADVDSGARFPGRRRRGDGAHRPGGAAGKFSAEQTRHRPWPSSRRAWWWRRLSARRWAAGSRTIIPGAGFFTSTCRWASWPCSWPNGWWKTRLTSSATRRRRLISSGSVCWQSGWRRCKSYWTKGRRRTGSVRHGSVGSRSFRPWP